MPVVKFGKRDRKQEVMRALHRRGRPGPGRSGVAAIGVAQEYQNVFAAYRREDTAPAWFSFYKADRRVTCFYFYLWDEDFGPAFIKVCAYFPYPVKVWLNGHEWAKRQATHAGIGFTELSNGFATCEDPAALQAICDRLGPGTIEVFFERWMSRAAAAAEPTQTGQGGYWWELSMRQIEISRTIVFDAPRHARGFFEALVVDNLDIGRPDTVELIFAGHPRRWGRPPKVEPTYKTRIVTRDTVGVTVNADYKHSRIKQYLKDGRALRIETVINYPDDLLLQPPPGAPRRAAGQRLVPSTPACSILNVSGRVVSLRAQPLSGSRSPPSPRMAGGRPHYGSEILGSWPCSAPCVSALNALGFTNRSLRAQVSQLLGVRRYTVNQMSYDLARLRLKGLIARRPKTNTYDLTADGPTRRDLLHQGPRPTPPPADRRRRTTRTPRAPPSPGHHRPPRQRSTSTTPGWQGRLKLKTIVKVLGT